MPDITAQVFQVPKMQDSSAERFIASARLIRYTKLVSIFISKNFSKYNSNFDFFAATNKDKSVKDFKEVLYKSEVIVDIIVGTLDCCGRNMKVLVGNEVARVGSDKEPTVEVDREKLIKEELNRGCPLGVSRVTNSLYICGAHALPGAVKALHPGLVVNAAPELPPPPEDFVARHYVPLLDTPNSDMHPFMENVADLINEVVKNGGVVLVHCVAGVSRSVTLCLAYLVKYQKMTLRDAYNHMKQRRPQVRPNTGFFKQLIKYEERLFGEASVKMVYCEVIDKEIPDVYEPDYRGMAWFRQRYGPIEKS